MCVERQTKLRFFFSLDEMSDFDLCLQSLPSLGIFRKAPQEVLGEESVCVSRLLFTAVRGSIRIESECGQRVQERKEGPTQNTSEVKNTFPLPTERRMHTGKAVTLVRIE